MGAMAYGPWALSQPSQQRLGNIEEDQIVELAWLVPHALLGRVGQNGLDLLIPLSEHHLQMTIRDWEIHYNRGRPHSALAPGLPEPKSEQVPANEHRHSLPVG